MKSETMSQTKLKQIQKDKHQSGLPTQLLAGRVDGSQILHAHLAAADVGADEAGLERVSGWCALEVLLRNCGQPEAVLVSEVMAGPRPPLHSINGVARKSSRQLPGDTSDWPPPSSPAAVCMRNEYPIHKLRHPAGQWGIETSWLWTAMATAGASHTEQRLM